MRTSKPCRKPLSPEFRTRTARALFAAALGIGMSCAAGCQHDGDAEPFDPRKLGQDQRVASRYQQTAPMDPLATEYGKWVAPRNRKAVMGPASRPFSARYTGQEPTESLKLEDVIHRTVTHNLDVRAAGYGPAIDAARVLEAQANFDPVFFASLQADVSNRTTGGSTVTIPALDPIDSQTVFTDHSKSQVMTGAFGIRQNLETGGQISIQQQFKQTNTDPDSTILSRYKESDLILQLTQPLLRDFGGVVNRARIDLARNQQRQTLLDFRKAVEEAVFNAEQAYWQLWQVQQQVKILEAAVAQADADVNILGERRANDATVNELAQSQADAASRRAQLTKTRQQLRDLSDQIKVLMNDPDYPVADITVLLAAEQPLKQTVRFDLDELVNTALEHRLELGQQQLKVDAQGITLDAAKNNLLPKLDFKGQVDPMGLSGNGYDAAFSNMTDFDRISYSLGLQFEVPLGNREAEAIYRRTLLSRTQAITTLHSLYEQVAADVKIKHRDVEASWQQLAYYRESTLAQQKALEVQESQLRAGKEFDSFFIRNKLDTELRVAEARIQEVGALASYNIAIASLERSKGTLLKYNNITLEEEGSGALAK